MKLIGQSQVLLDNDLFSKDEKLEYCGRVCYNSQNAIQPGSAEKFIGGIVKRGHTSVLEHAEISLIFEAQEYVDNEYYTLFNVQPNEYNLYKFFIFEDVEGQNGKFYKVVSANIRAWYNWALEAKKFKIESTNVLYCLGSIFNTLKNQSTVFNFVETDNDYGFAKVLCNKGIYDVVSKTIDYDIYLVDFYNDHCAIYTFEINTTRGTMAQLTRHRCLGFSCQSTRYCNYATDKFGKDIKFIINAPSVNDVKPIEKMCKEAEKAYFSIIENGGKPEDARSVLPQCLATIMMVSGTFDSWRSVFAMRCDPHAQEEIRVLCTGIKDAIENIVYAKENKAIQKACDLSDAYSEIYALEYGVIRKAMTRVFDEKELRQSANEVGLEIRECRMDKENRVLSVVFESHPDVTFNLKPNA